MKHVVRKPVLQNAIGGDSHPGIETGTQLVSGSEKGVILRFQQDQNVAFFDSLQRLRPTYFL